jgi:nucleotide-binding universal stress UspA family protein
MATQHAPAHAAVAAPSAPFPRVICAVDGSRGAEAAVAQALVLAGGDAQLTFLAVTDVRGSGATRMASLGPQYADEALQAAHRAARAAGVDAAEIVRRAEDPRVRILEEAAGHDLLVLGTHGRHRTAGILLGSTPLFALHRSPVPVLIARPARVGTEFPRDILLATDGSPAMRRTFALTAELARRHGARDTHLHGDRADRATRHELAVEAATLEQATGVAPIVLQVDGHAPSRIAEAALELPASLVISGSRMLTGIRSLASVSERTGVVAPCSVLVVRGGA